MHRSPSEVRTKKNVRPSLWIRYNSPNNNISTQIDRRINYYRIIMTAQYCSSTDGCAIESMNFFVMTQSRFWSLFGIRAIHVLQCQCVCSETCMNNYIRLYTLGDGHASKHSQYVPFYYGKEVEFLNTNRETLFANHTRSDVCCCHTRIHITQ